MRPSARSAFLNLLSAFNRGSHRQVYELNLGDFSPQAGASVGEGDYFNPQRMFQIGYMYRFLED